MESHVSLASRSSATTAAMACTNPGVSADWLVTAEPAPCLQTVHDPGDNRLRAQPTKRRQFPFRKHGRGERGSELRQVSRCHPKAAPFFSATMRASSFAASGLAPMISTSSASTLLSSQARAQPIRRWFTAEVTTIALTGQKWYQPWVRTQSGLGRSYAQFEGKRHEDISDLARKHPTPRDLNSTLAAFRWVHGLEPRNNQL